MPTQVIQFENMEIETLLMGMVHLAHGGDWTVKSPKSSKAPVKLFWREENPPPERSAIEQAAAERLQQRQEESAYNEYRQARIVDAINNLKDVLQSGGFKTLNTDAKNNALDNLAILLMRWVPPEE